MVNAEFRRDMQQNLLVLRDQEARISSFQEKMIEYNSLQGLIPFRIQRMDGERMLFYDLFGIQPLTEVCQRILPNVVQLTTLVRSILCSIRQVAEYLLKEDDLILSVEYMFVNLPSYEVKLCYYPGFQVSIKKQLSQLFEKLMSCVDYEDRDAVYLMYSLYMKSKDESCTVLDLEQVLKGDNSSVKVESTKTQEYFVREEIPLAMSTSVMPPDLGIGQNVIHKRSDQEETKKASVIRPLISNHRVEEKEVWYYPPSCFLLGGAIVAFVVLALGFILTTDILFDPVLKKLEPIKLVAMLCILLFPSIYGCKKIFDPNKKVSKMVSYGPYELKEIAATKEAVEYERPVQTLQDVSTRMGSASKGSLSIDADLGVNKGISQGISQGIKHGIIQNAEQGICCGINQGIEQGMCRGVNQSIDKEQKTEWEKIGVFERERQEDAEGKKRVSDNRTVLLNGIQATPFAQLISERPEKADTITLVECPFYIGTVRNQMNYSLSCPVISRYHAKIEKLEGIYYISDLNSTNGTFVNGRRLKADEPNVLIAGDKIAFANISFIFACPN